MKKVKVFSALLLALTMLFSASCGKEAAEPTTEADASEENTLQTQDLTQADQEYLKAYLADYAAGEFEGEKIFDYERFDEFLAPFEYKGLTYPADAMIEGVVTDQDVEDYLTLFSLATRVTDDQYEEISDGVVQRYDVATIDFRGLVDGQESDATSGSDQTLVIGSGNFIDGFESGLIGKKVGEEVRLDLKFSPYYQADEVAGKDVTFFVTVKKIQRPTIPAFSLDAINENYQTEFKTEEEAKSWFKQALEAQAKNEAYSALSTYLQKKLLENLQVVQYPEREVEYYSAHFMAAHERAKGDLDWNGYCSETLGTTYEELQKEAELYAKEQVSPLLMIYYIARAEGITCTTEQMGSFIEGFYTTQNTDGYYGDLKSMVTDCTDFYGAGYFEEQVIGAMVSEKIIEYAVKEAV